jgi:hypothetical protein
MSEPAKTSSWGTALLAGIFGLIGVLVGGFLQYLFSGSLETEKQRMQIQLSAYADFAKAQAAWQRAQLERDELKKEAAKSDAALKIRDANFRIVVFSPPEVVRALAAFMEENHNEQCGTTDADIAVYQTIRRQKLDSDYIPNLITRKIMGQVSDHVSNQEVAMALFGCKLK